MKNTSDVMNAILQGVQARYDSLFGLTDKVTETTVEVARRLGIPSDEIQKWVEDRRKSYLKFNCYMKEAEIRSQGAEVSWERHTH